MTRFLTSLALVLITVFAIAHSRTCKNDGESCNSENDCNSGICEGQKCQKKTRILDDESLTLIDDMVFSKEQLRSGIIGENYRWPNRTLPYEVDPTYTPTEFASIYEAFEILNKKTCLKFIPRTNEEDWVYYRNGHTSNNSGCYSSVGRQGGKQTLNLGFNCVYVKTVIHETIHALGFYHEQSRYDRDDFVTINWENIPCKNKHNFNKHTDKEVSTFGLDYDYPSIMHYDAYEFAIDKKIRTIIPKKPGVQQLGGRALTETDIQKISRMYGC